MPGHLRPVGSEGTRARSTARARPSDVERDHERRRTPHGPAGRRGRLRWGVSAGPSIGLAGRPGPASPASSQTTRAALTLGLGTPGHGGAVGPFLGRSRPGATRPGARGSDRPRSWLCRSGRSIAAAAGRSAASPAPRAAWRRRRRTAPLQRAWTSAIRIRSRGSLGIGSRSGRPSDQGVCSAHRYASWMIASRSGRRRGEIQRAALIGVEPGGVDDQGIAAPALGQPTSQVAEVRAEVVPLHLPSRRPGPPGATRPTSHSGSTAATAQHPRPQSCPARATASGSGSPASRASPAGRDPDRDRMPPEPVQELRRRAR